MSQTRRFSRGGGGACARLLRFRSSVDAEVLGGRDGPPPLSASERALDCCSADGYFLRENQSSLCFNVAHRFLEQLHNLERFHAALQRGSIALEEDASRVSPRVMQGQRWQIVRDGQAKDLHGVFSLLLPCKQDECPPQQPPRDWCQPRSGRVSVLLREEKGLRLPRLEHDVQRSLVPQVKFPSGRHAPGTIGAVQQQSVRELAGHLGMKSLPVPFGRVALVARGMHPAACACRRADEGLARRDRQLHLDDGR
mmetsp:Transcript_8940/g.33722  ORF Transcript_8940/g.33722 Transcript_8940/m.33722 type:complete len:253 (+) Transcript_8940:485-1243(+)